LTRIQNASQRMDVLYPRCKRPSAAEKRTYVANIYLIYLVKSHLGKSEQRPNYLGMLVESRHSVSPYKGHYVCPTYWYCVKNPDTSDIYLASGECPLCLQNGKISAFVVCQIIS